MKINDENITNVPSNAGDLDVEGNTSPTVRETKIRVHRTINVDGDETQDSEEEVIAVHQFATMPASAYVTVPIKISRNYQSAGIEVGVSLPCYKEELPEAIELAYRMAKERVFNEIPAIQSALDKISGRAASVGY